MTESNRLYFAPREAPPGAPRSLRILVVDDDRDLVLTTMMLLRDEGHEVQGIHEGSNVLNAMQVLEPDVVLLDIGLPDSTGYEIARQIRRRYGKHRPMLIAITAWAKVSDRMLAEMAGFDHHLPKPYNPQALFSLLAPLRTPI